MTIDNFFLDSKTKSLHLYALPMYIGSCVIAILLSLWVKYPAYYLSEWKSIKVSKIELRI